MFAAMLLDRFFLAPSSLPPPLLLYIVGMWVWQEGVGGGSLPVAKIRRIFIKPGHLKYLSISSTSQCIGSVGVIYFSFFAIFLTK